MADDSNLRPTLGESLVSTLIAAVCALIAAAIGFVGGVFLCGWLFTGEMAEWALIVAPVAALVFGVLTFVLVFRSFSRFGNPS